MNRKQKSRFWSALLTCLMLALCPVTPRLAGAQTDQERGIPKGYVIIDGDILMPVEVVEAMRKQPKSPEATFQTNFWPSGIVPFEFDDNVTEPNRTAMLNAMAELESIADVDFQQCPGNYCDILFTYYVHIQNSSKNSSAVGRVFNQFINITSWGSKFIIVHELMHCLGFWHEQQRPDRDSFVRINCANVQDGCSGDTFDVNFKVSSAATAYGHYDFDSVMHYGQCSFAANPCPPNTTITVLPPNDVQWQGAIGQRNHLSAMDQASVSFIYPFSNWRFLDTSYDGSNGSSNGTFLRPYTSFTQAVDKTPAGGTIWLLRTQTIPALGTYNKQLTIKAAPGVVGTLGD